MLGGRPPSKSISNNTNRLNLISFPIEDGIFPESLLVNNANASNLTSFPIPIGREPVKRFPCSDNKFKLARFSIPTGMLPKMRLFSKCKLVSRIDKLASELGNAPIRRLLSAPNVKRLVQLLNEVINKTQIILTISSTPQPIATET